MAPSSAPEPLERYLDVAVDCARSAGQIIAEAFKQPKRVEAKGSATDLVTDTDKKAEELILAKIKAAFPSHKFIGEEGSAAQGFTSALTDEPTWMCDPLGEQAIAGRGKGRGVSAAS